MKILFTNCVGSNTGDKYCLPSLFYSFENIIKNTLINLAYY